MRTLSREEPNSSPRLNRPAQPVEAGTKPAYHTRKGKPTPAANDERRDGPAAVEAIAKTAAKPLREVDGPHALAVGQLDVCQDPDLSDPV